MTVLSRLWGNWVAVCSQIHKRLRWVYIQFTKSTDGQRWFRVPVMESDTRMLGLEIKTKDRVSTKSRQDGQFVTYIFTSSDTNCTRYRGSRGYCTRWRMDGKSYLLHQPWKNKAFKATTIKEGFDFQSFDSYSSLRLWKGFRGTHCGTVVSVFREWRNSSSVSLGCWHLVASIWRAKISFRGFTKSACNIPTAAPYSVHSSMCWKIEGDPKFANTESLSRFVCGRTAKKLSNIRFQWSHSFEASPLLGSVSRRSGRSTLSIEIGD